MSSTYLSSLAFLRNNDYDSNAYPFTIPAISRLDSLSFKTNVTFLIGENGSGKSTLLEAIAYQCEFNLAGGGKNNYYDVDASQSILGEQIHGCQKYIGKPYEGKPHVQFDEQFLIGTVFMIR